MKLRKLAAVLLAICIVISSFPVSTLHVHAEETAAATESVPEGLESSCTHKWAEATCNLPETCTLCGVTEGGALGHSFKNGVCSVCGLPTNIPDGLGYKVYTVFVQITGYTGTATEVIIPAVIEGKPVTSIGSHAFEDCSKLTSIVIPDSVKSIGEGAFRGCSNLTSIELPGSVTSIGGWAFEGCSNLTSIELLGSVTSIESYAFEWCSKLTSIVIPDSVEFIGDGAFRGCSNLTSIELPDSVKSIGGSAFGYCSSLTSIEIPDGVWSIESGTFSGCSDLTSIVIPDSVKSIGDGAFSDCSSLTSIAITDSVKSIGARAFRFCSSLTSIEIPDGVESIGNSAFYGCSRLTAIVFTGTAISFRSNCFSGVEATAYYPSNDPTWTEDVRQNYGGDITWKSSCAVHTWKAADCIEPKTCTVCGATVGKALGHNHVKGVCTVCGDKTWKFVTQPKTAYAKNGEKAKVTVKAEGEELTYAWYYKDPGKTKFSKSTITSSSYSITMSEARSGRQVYCKITDKYGNTAKSNTVYLRMSATIETQPKTAYAKLNSYAKTSVTAVGEGLEYVWYAKDPGKTKFSKTTCTKAQYSVPMTEARNGRQVYCKVTDRFGKTAKSNTVTLYMSASIVTQPKNVTAAKNKTAKVSVKAAGDGLTYTWYAKDPGKTKFSKTTCTKAEYSVTMTSARNGRQVYCKVTDKHGKYVKSNTVTLKMG